MSIDALSHDPSHGEALRFYVIYKLDESLGVQQRINGNFLPWNVD
jgi:hypothetical protein